jgi:hypothetical protein
VMTPAPSLQDLIDSVRTDAASEDVLDQLAQASRTAADLEEVGDALLGHFVDQSRRSGHSWSEISTALGVTKQAAHKRFSFDISRFEADSPVFERFTPRARAVLNAAAGQATRRGHGQIEPGDLLLALFEPRGSIAAELLLAAAIKPADCEQQLSPARSKPAVTEPSGATQFSVESKHVLKSAVEEALRLSHDYIGTEHLLLGLYHDPDGDAAKTLATLGLTYDDARRRVDAALEKFRAAG